MKGEGSMHRVNKEQTGGRLELEVGDQFEIELPENPTTGFRWHYRSASSPILEMEDDSFQAAGKTRGAGGF